MALRRKLARFDRRTPKKITSEATEPWRARSTYHRAVKSPKGQSRNDRHAELVSHVRHNRLRFPWGQDRDLSR